jgi:hypothetical protein
MNPEQRSSPWFHLGIVCLVLAVGPFAIGFLTMATWGLILVVFVPLIWFVPLLLLHWIAWGRSFERHARQLANSQRMMSDRVSNAGSFAQKTPARTNIHRAVANPYGGTV